MRTIMRLFVVLALLVPLLGLTACSTFLDKLGETGAHASIDFMGATLSAGFNGKEVVSAAVQPAVYVLDATGIHKETPTPPAPAPAPAPPPKATVPSDPTPAPAK